MQKTKTAAYSVGTGEKGNIQTEFPNLKKSQAWVSYAFRINLSQGKLTISLPAYSKL